MKKVQIITDGSCIGNPGPGGWACILRFGSEERELSGSEAQSTNNRMELAAAINGLKALRETCEVELVTDSQYLKQGITQSLGAVEDKRLENVESKASDEPGFVA